MTLPGSSFKWRLIWLPKEEGEDHSRYRNSSGPREWMGRRWGRGGWNPARLLTGHVPWHTGASCWWKRPFSDLRRCSTCAINSPRRTCVNWRTCNWKWHIWGRLSCLVKLKHRLQREPCLGRWLQNLLERIRDFGVYPIGSVSRVRKLWLNLCDRSCILENLALAAAWRGRMRMGGETESRGSETI